MTELEEVQKAQRIGEPHEVRAKIVLTDRRKDPCVGQMLRDVTEADLPIFFEHQRDPEAYGMAAFAPREREAFMTHWRTNVLGDPANIARAVVEGGQVVGNVGSFVTEGRRMIGYWIGREHWGKGLATKALADFTKDHDRTRPLYAFVATHNVGSIRVLKKCGFEVAEGPIVGTDGVEELVFSLSAPRARTVAAGDVGAIAAIYNHYVARTTVTFEEAAVLDDEMARRIHEVGAASLPWLTAEEGGRVVGYAYATQWRPRSGYRFAVEITVYLDPGVPGRGIGTALYTELFARLQARGVHSAIGGIALPNDASVALHEKFGMKKVAHLKEVGFKLGRWIDVGYWQRILV